MRQSQPGQTKAHPVPVLHACPAMCLPACRSRAFSVPKLARTQSINQSHISSALLGVSQDLLDFVPPSQHVLLQDILAGIRTSSGGAPMTVAEATTIADNALEHSVRTVLASLAAPLFLAWRSGMPIAAARVVVILGTKLSTAEAALQRLVLRRSHSDVPMCLRAASRALVGNSWPPGRCAGSPRLTQAALTQAWCHVWSWLQLPDTATRGKLTATGICIVGNEARSDRVSKGLLNAQSIPQHQGIRPLCLTSSSVGAGAPKWHEVHRSGPVPRGPMPQPLQQSLSHPGALSALGRGTGRACSC